MIYRFGPFQLDTHRGLLSGSNGDVQLEPRAWDVLTLLVENHDRIVSRDELISAVWSGRAVSDAAVATPIKAIRRALDDDGSEQRYLKTIRGRGFRFVAPVEVAAEARVETEVPEALPPDPSGRPKIAILPFETLAADPALAAVGEGIPSELIASLSRLRWLDVVARGSTFRFRDGAAGLQVIGSLTGAGYVMSGTVEQNGPSLSVTVELADSRSDTVVWADRIETRRDDLHEVRPRIVREVLAALDLHIPRNEAARARTRPSERLDAWGAYHIGLQHMYRFNPHDNALAEQHLKQATALDPGFSAAFSARSFAQFQRAFLRFGQDNAADVAETRRLADLAYELDPDDPYASFSVGRAMWLEHRSEEGLAWLDEAIELDPNFAKAFYTRSSLNLQMNRPEKTQADVGRALELSPLDPLMPPFCAVQALALMQLNDPAAALPWAVRAASSPRAHYIGMYPAMIAPALLGDRDLARYWMGRVLDRRADASVADLFRSIPFQDTAFAQRARQELLDLGLPEG
jgi:DNA-binding winged helix-turn-helix (wHTH) protein/tetratricopeptide (TPR) repeat protein